jgi:hypothetical protein
MTPTTFPQANATFGPPSDLAESQCHSIPAYVGQIAGSCDGARVVITAWKPTAAELEQLNAGGVVFLSVLGGLPPHYIGTGFDQMLAVK